MPANRKLLLAFAALLVSLSYLGPQITHRRRGYSGIFHRSADEMSYQMRMQEALMGELSERHPWTYEHKNDPTMVPSVPELTLAAPALLWNRLGLKPITSDQVFVAAQAVLPALDYLAFAWLLLTLGVEFHLSILAALIVFWDPGLLEFSPLGSIFFNVPVDFTINRITNPLFGLLVFFVSLTAGKRAIDSEKTFSWWAAAAGALIALQFHVSVFYWTHSALALALYVLLWRRSRWKTLASIAGIASVGAGLFAVRYLEMARHPDYQNLIWRGAFGVHERPWYALFHKKLWILLALSAPLYRRKLLTRPVDRGAAFLLASTAAGLVCFFSNLIVGVSVQNFHWLYTLAPCVYAGCLWSLGTLTGRRWPLALLSGVAILCLAASTHNDSILFRRAPKSERQIPTVQQLQYQPAWDWLAANSERDSVVLASDPVEYLTAINTGRRVWEVSGHLYVEFMSSEEILGRFQLMWFLDGLQGDGLRARIALPESLHIPIWPHGLTRKMEERLIREGRPPFTHALRTRLIEELVVEQASVDPARLKRGLGGYRLDYLLMGPAEARWSERAPRLFDLEPVQRFPDVTVFRVKGWK